MTQSFRIMLVDDHALVRQGCKQALEAAGFDVVAEAANGEAAYQGFFKISPDAVVMDLSMNNVSGWEVIDRICSRAPGARILVLTMHDEPTLAARALKAGALGYITKTADADTLVEAVRRVARGELYLSPEIAMPLAVTDVLSTDNPLAVLSPREFEVFRMLVDGTSNADIATALSLSQKTVTNCNLRIKQKLGQRSLADLVKLALRCGVTRHNAPPTPELIPEPARRRQR
jgi:DNA-binding NarL/FixJ family response regulator